MAMPTSLFRDGEWYDRVTVKFSGGKGAAQARAWVHDALIRAHGFRTATRLTKRLAVSGGRFRVPIARRLTKKLVRRLRLLIDAKMITVFVAGRSVRMRDHA